MSIEFHVVNMSRGDEGGGPIADGLHRSGRPVIIGRAGAAGQCRRQRAKIRLADNRKQNNLGIRPKHGEDDDGWRAPRNACESNGHRSRVTGQEAFIEDQQ